MKHGLRLWSQAEVLRVWSERKVKRAVVDCAQFVSSAIQFLASVAERPAYKQLFADTNTLTGICEKVIVPNMEFRGVSLLTNSSHISSLYYTNII